MAALREVAGQAGVALAAGRDCPDEDALADVVADDARTQLLDDADGLVAEDQSRLDRVLALDDVDVGPADRRQGDPDDRLAGTRPRPLDLLYFELVGRVEHVRPHGVNRDHRLTPFTSHGYRLP